MPTVCYRAPVVCPMTGPPFAHGGVLVDGDRIVAVGAAATVSREASRTHDVDGVLLPGLVNGHAVLEQTDAHGLARRGPHHAWVRALRGTTAGWDAGKVRRSARRGVQHLLRAGVTTTADTVLQGPAVPAAGRAGLAGDSFVDVAMVDVEHADAVVRALDSSLRLPAEGRRVGVSPAGPHLVSAAVLRALTALADARDVPLQTPCARTHAEVAAIREGDGPLAEDARAAGMAFEWLEAPTGLTPVRHLDACGGLRAGATIVHGVHVDRLEARLLAERGVAVVCTPRADDLLQAGDAPLERYADAGVALALGTGTAAGVGDLDLLAEAAAWAALARRRDVLLWPSSVGPLPVEEHALRLATVDGARAMGWGAHAGVLEPGRRADLVAVAVRTTPERAYRDVVEQGPGRQVLTVLAGVRKARRAGPDDPWPPIETEDER